MTGLNVERSVRQAAHNNACWCDTICRAHNAPGEFHAAFWINHGTVPPHIPHLITLGRAEHTRDQLAAIRSLADNQPERSLAVKDAFQRLQLTRFGFSVLFQATWIIRPPEIPVPVDSAERLKWSIVQDGSELADWELAWRASAQNAATLHSRVFVPSLLEEADVHFLAGRSDGAVIAAAALNRSGDVVGISNVCSGVTGMGPLFPGCVRVAQQLYPGLAIVGYERGADLAAAEQVGFRRLRDLTVWHKPQQTIVSRPRTRRTVSRASRLTGRVSKP